MQNILILSGISVVIIISIVIAALIFGVNRRVRNLEKTLTYQYNLIVKIQSVLKNRSNTK